MNPPYISKGDSVTNTVLIIGESASARRIGEVMAAEGVPTLFVSGGAASSFPAEARVLEHAEVAGCRGGPGSFTVTLRRNGEKIEEPAAALVVAESHDRVPNPDAYGLTLSPRVRPLSEIFSGKLPDSTLEPGKTAVFLHGLARESHPAIAEEVMRAAGTLSREHGLKTYILTGNLKVARNGLEKVYRSARRDGVVFAKFTDTRPEIRRDSSGIRISFIDEITRGDFRLAPDLVVVDETAIPSPALEEISTVLELHRDPAGFPQADNVHRLSARTNREGIFAVGPARGLLGEDLHLADADAAAVEVLTALRGPALEEIPRAEIMKQQCIRCLTCYRVCPHRAVRFDPTRLQVIPEACDGCGICATECPREAIRFAPFTLPEVENRITAARRDHQEKAADSPFLVVFCCGRSAVPARDQALRDGWKPGGGICFIDVPCAGTVSTDHLYAAFRGRADGVLVLSCHPDNCHSEKGTLYARRKVAEVRELFVRMGMAKEKVASATLAANMGAGFVRIIEDFQQQTVGSDPSAPL